MHKENRNDLYSLPEVFSGEFSVECDQLRTKIRRRMWRELRRSEMYREFWCGNPKQNRTIFRLRLTLKDGIETNFKEHYRRFESGLTASAKVHTTAVLNTAMNIWVSKNAGIFESSSWSVAFSKRTLLLDIFKSDNN